MKVDNEASIPTDDYRTYVRLRSLNRSLTKLAPWLGVWMLAGAVGMVVGMIMQPEAEIIGVDPAGRGWKLKIVDHNGHEMTKGVSGE